MSIYDETTLNEAFMQHKPQYTQKIEYLRDCSMDANQSKASCPISVL